MKKIMFIILALLLGINANAQFISDPQKGDFAKFKLGEYVFDDIFAGDIVSMEKVEKGGGHYVWRGHREDKDEADSLWRFILIHKEEIEKKYNVTIEAVVKWGWRDGMKNPYNLNNTHPAVDIEVYDTDTYNKYMEKEKERDRFWKEYKERERKKRTESLNTIL